MKKNWGALWFELRAGLGQSDMATVMYRDGENAPLVIENFRHREADGLGKIQAIMLKSGVRLRVVSKKLKPPPAFLHFYYLLGGLLKHPVASVNPWKHFQPELKPDPSQLSSWTLSDEQEKHLRILAKNRSVSPSFLLIHRLSGLLREKLYRDPSREALWLFPVDLRGAFPEAPLEDLVVSFIPLHLREGTLDSLRPQYDRMREQLKSGQYWHFHALYQIGRWIGRRGMMFLIRRSHNKSFWMGSFSDLGEWNQEEIRQSPARDRVWQIAPPGSASYPVGFTTIVWNGRRTLTLKIHPAITTRNPEELAKEIMTGLREDLARIP
ncbi:MAG: hypothetical protein KF865_10730 [Bdellovibrionaceae bacterium]|nr:hypothetical protein [Pseudobdellovibrionaceae bacterium]